MSAGPDLTYVYWILGLLLAGFIWHKFLRLRCPECQAVSPDTINEEELDRWRGRKTVSERLGNGKYRTRNVSTTYVKVDYTYRCNTCGHEWSQTVKKELR